jgi:hypothetical protein
MSFINRHLNASKTYTLPFTMCKFSAMAKPPREEPVVDKLQVSTTAADASIPLVDGKLKLH